MLFLTLELLRWRPVNKFGMNHHLIEDDWFKGHFLPKDSVIMLNWWAIHYDEERYPDPGNFIPERYLDHKLPAADYIAIGDPYKRDHFTYGAGRRACPGVHVAEKSMVHGLPYCTDCSTWLLLESCGASISLGPRTRTVRGLSRT